jgi:hypothetical protein
MHLQFVDSESTFAYFDATRAYLEAPPGQGLGLPLSASSFAATEWRHLALVRVKDKTGCETRQIEMRLEVICLICLAV